MCEAVLDRMTDNRIVQEKQQRIGEPVFLKKSCHVDLQSKEKVENEDIRIEQRATHRVQPNGTVISYDISNIQLLVSNLILSYSSPTSEDANDELPEDGKELTVDIREKPLQPDVTTKIEFTENEFISVQETGEHEERVLPVTAKSDSGIPPLDRHTSDSHQTEDFQQASTRSEVLERGQQSESLCQGADLHVSDGSEHLLRNGQQSIIPQATNPQDSFGSMLAGKDETDSSSITQAETSQQVGTSHSKKSTAGAKDCGKKVAGGDDSTENKKERNSKQQKENKSASAGDSADISLPGSGDAGDGRKGDDGQGGDDDGKKKCKPTTDVVKTEEEEEKEKKEEEEEMEEEEQKMDENYYDKEIVEKPLNTVQCLKAAFQSRADLRNCLGPSPTTSSRAGDDYLRHLQQCSLGHVACEESHQVVCEECRQYLSSLEELISITVKEEALFLFPFFDDYIRANTQKERHLVIFLWLYERLPGKSLKAEICRKKLKRIRLSSSQGACPKKKFRVGSSESMDTEPTPSPDDSPEELFRQNAVPCQRPSVIQGTRQQLQLKLNNWNRNEEVDGEVNDGVILVGHLKPQQGHYRLWMEFSRLKRLGRGSYGEVCLAADNNTGQEFVYKVVDEERFEDNEVLIWMQLDHPHIVPLWGVVRSGSKIYMMSEFIASQTLTDRLGVSFTERNLDYVEIMKQLLQVLEYIHNMNIVHMDIKPDNILLTADGIRLIDWGLSLHLDDNGVQRLEEPRGTEVYAAPEVIACESFTTTCDIWSSICTAMHLFFGSPPWVQRFFGLRTYQYIICSRSPPIEDIPANTPPAIRNFLIEGFGCKENRPSATELLKNPLFSDDEFMIPRPPPDRLSPSGSEDISLSMEEAADPLPPLDFDACFKALGDKMDNSESLDKTGGSSHQQEFLTSPECRMQDHPPLTSNVDTLQLVGHQPRPDYLPVGGAVGVDKYDINSQATGGAPRTDRDEFINQSSLERLLQELQLDSTSESYGSRTHRILDENAIVNIDDEDIYGPGPADQNEVQTLELRSETQASTLSKETLGQIHSTENDSPTPLSEAVDISQTEDRRSSCYSSVFDSSFPCLGSTPGTDTPEDKSSEGVFSTSSSHFKFPASGGSEQQHRLERLYSEISLTNELTEILQNEEVTSGFVTATTNTQDIPPPSEEDTVHSNSSAELTVCICGTHISVGYCASTYGDLAIGISPKVYEIYEEEIPRFVLVDNAGNLFDVNAIVDPSCEILVVVAEEGMAWSWCITPEKEVELRN